MKLDKKIQTKTWLDKAEQTKKNNLKSQFRFNLSKNTILHTPQLLANV